MSGPPKNMNQNREVPGQAGIQPKYLEERERHLRNECQAESTIRDSSRHQNFVTTVRHHMILGREKRDHRRWVKGQEKAWITNPRVDVMILTGRNRSLGGYHSTRQTINLSQWRGSQCTILKIKTSHRINPSSIFYGRAGREEEGYSSQ